MVPIRNPKMELSAHNAASVGAAKPVPGRPPVAALGK